jgi:hypothetical protein
MTAYYAMQEANASDTTCCMDATFSCALVNEAQDVFQCAAAEGKALILAPETQVGNELTADICCTDSTCANTPFTCTDMITEQALYNEAGKHVVTKFRYCSNNFLTMF